MNVATQRPRVRTVFRHLSLCIALALPIALAGCGAGNDPDPAQYGAEPPLPETQRGLLPSMEIARPTAWAAAASCRGATRSPPSPPT